MGGVTSKMVRWRRNVSKCHERHRESLRPWTNFSRVSQSLLGSSSNMQQHVGTTSPRAAGKKRFRRIWVACLEDLEFICQVLHTPNFLKYSDFSLTAQPSSYSFSRSHVENFVEYNWLLGSKRKCNYNMMHMDTSCRYVQVHAAKEHPITSAMLHFAMLNDKSMTNGTKTIRGFKRHHENIMQLYCIVLNYISRISTWCNSY